MALHDILNALIEVTAAMSPYLLLGFLIAGVLHVYVPKMFYAKYLSRDNKWSVLWAALLGVPLPLPLPHPTPSSSAAPLPLTMCAKPSNKQASNSKA